MVVPPAPPAEEVEEVTICEVVVDVVDVAVPIADLSAHNVPDGKDTSIFLPR